MGRVLTKNVYLEKEGDVVRLLAGTEVPRWAEDLITNPKAFESDDETPEEESAAAVPVGYAALTVEQLQVELKGRELPVSGNKPELVERLEADDAEKSKE